MIKLQLDLNTDEINTIQYYMQVHNLPSYDYALHHMIRHFSLEILKALEKPLKVTHPNYIDCYANCDHNCERCQIYKIHMLEREGQW